MELEEQARIDKRNADRAARAAIRFAKLEAVERRQMEEENSFGHQLRFYEWETLQIEREREGMWYEEREQCDVDRFWGLEMEALRLQNIRTKYINFYENRTAALRKKLICTKQIRPFNIEVQRKKILNPFTNEVLLDNGNY